MRNSWSNFEVRAFLSIIHLQYSKFCETISYNSRCQRRLINTLANPLLLQRSAKSRNTFFTNQRFSDLHLYLSLLYRLFTGLLHKSYRLAYPVATFFLQQKEVSSLCSPRFFAIHPLCFYIHVAGNEPVSISIGNWERRGCSAASIRRSRVTDELVNNTAMVADRIAIVSEIPMVGWQERVFSFFSAARKL